MITQETSHEAEIQHASERWQAPCEQPLLDWLSAELERPELRQEVAVLLVTHLGSEPRLAALIDHPVAQVLSHRLPVVLDHLWLGLEALLPKPTHSITPEAAYDSPEIPESGLASAVASPACAHTGKVVEWHWHSRKGYHYTQKSWDCCGANEGQTQCRRTPGRYHPGEPSGSGSRRSGGGGCGFWSCCYRALSEPGCQDEDSLKPTFE